MSIIKLEQVTSTNDYLKEHALNLNNYDICIADYQTKGRGRMNRNWESEPKTNLMMSILIKDLKKRTNYSNITLLAGCAVHQFLSKYLEKIEIKWPNDLLINHQKICGILAEGQTIANNKTILIIGIGININQKEYSLDIEQHTTSLAKETNQTYNLDELAKELSAILIQKIDGYLELDDSFIAYLRKHLYARGSMISYEEQGTLKEAVLLDVDEEGNLIINSANTLKRVKAGEIKIIRNKN